jgi:putative aldouronate transport system permease protein
VFNKKETVKINKISVKDSLKKNKGLYLMLLLPLLWYVIFCYAPMFGIVIGFQDYHPGDPYFIGAHWVGLKHITLFINSPYFFRLVRNTFVLAFLTLLVGFPAPIILALMLNEVKMEKFKKTVQTISYLPHFISIIIICGLVIDFTSNNGAINGLRQLLFNSSPISFLDDAKYYRSIYVISDVWASIGWSSIIYLAALTAVSPSLYEAAELDGASRLQKIWHIALPTIRPTITILFILAVGGILSSNLDKAMNLARPITYTVSDNIAYYVYRKGIEESQFSFSTAIDLFSSVINFLFLITANLISRKLSEGENSLF